jgi:hypothetical protein
VFTSAPGLVLPNFDYLRCFQSSFYPTLDRQALRPVTRFPCSPWMLVTPSTTMAYADFCDAVSRPLDLLSLLSETRHRSPRIRYDRFPLTLAAFTWSRFDPFGSSLSIASSPGTPRLHTQFLSIKFVLSKFEASQVLLSGFLPTSVRTSAVAFG